MSQTTPEITTKTKSKKKTPNQITSLPLKSPKQLEN